MLFLLTILDFILDLQSFPIVLICFSMQSTHEVVLFS